MVPGRKERKEAVTSLRRQQILEAALEVFSREGFAKAATADIARTAGVSEGTIYNYFRSKRELLIEVIKAYIITTPLLELIDRLPSDVPGTLKLIMQNRIDLLESGLVSRVPLLMAEVIRDPELKAMWIKEFLHPFLSKVESVYRRLSESGVYRDIEPAAAVRVVAGTIFGFIILKTLEGDKSPLYGRPREEITGALAELMLHGLLRDAGVADAGKG